VTETMAKIYIQYQPMDLIKKMKLLHQLKTELLSRFGRNEVEALSTCSTLY